MPATITKSFRIHNAQQFKEAFSESNDTKMYLFIGREKEWPTANTPPTPVDTVQFSEYDSYRNMIAAKKISQSDVQFVIPRTNWASGTIYHEYQNKDSSLYANNFYVVTDGFNVYKCIFNNQGGTSTVKPTATVTDTIFKTADGYLWKYMYTISGADQVKFVDDNFIPVKELLTNDGSAQFTVQSSAANGAIGVIDVGSIGSAYINNSSTFASISNSTVLVANTGANSTDGIYTGSTIFISSGRGAGQLREIVNYVGTSRTLTVNNSFSVTPNTSSSYLISPKATISGDGSGALAYTNVAANGSIANVTIVSSGLNYSKANTVITANVGSGATAQTYLAPYGGHGSAALYELGGHNVMLNVRLGATDVVNLANADFRTIGLLKDPLLANGTIANSTTLNMTTRLTLTSKTGSFTEDERVLGGTSGASGRIVVFANTNATGTEGVLSLTEVEGAFTNTEVITANQSGITATTAGITGNEITPYTGEILYIENLVKVQRAIDQTEDVKLVIRF
jgi:hypothetical protein